MEEEPSYWLRKIRLESSPGRGSLGPVTGQQLFFNRFNGFHAKPDKPMTASPRPSPLSVPFVSSVIRNFFRAYTSSDGAALVSRDITRISVRRCHPIDSQNVWPWMFVA